MMMIETSEQWKPDIWEPHPHSCAPEIDDDGLDLKRWRRELNPHALSVTSIGDLGAASVSLSPRSLSLVASLSRARFTSLERARSGLDGFREGIDSGIDCIRQAFQIAQRGAAIEASACRLGVTMGRGTRRA